MTKIILAVIFLIACFLWSADFKLSLHPFRMSVSSLMTAIGWVLVVVGIAFVTGDARQKAKHEGYQQCTQDFIKSIKKVEDAKKEQVPGPNGDPQ